MEAGSVHRSLAQLWPSCRLRRGQAQLRDWSGRAAGSRIRHRLCGSRGSFLCNVLGNAPVPSLGACRLIAAATGASTVLCIDHALPGAGRFSASTTFVPPDLHCRASGRPRRRTLLLYRISYTGHFGDFHGFGICRFDTLPELSGQGVAGTARNCACWPGAFPCRQGRGCPRNAARAASAGCSAHAGGRHAGRAAAPSFPGQREREAGSQACVGVWTEPARACPARSGGRCRTRSCLRGQSRRVPPWRRRRAAGTACCWPGSPAPRKPPSCPRDVGARAGNRRPVPRAGLDCSGRFPDGARTD